MAAVVEWYRYQTVACLVTSLSSVPLKDPSLGDRLTNTFTKDFCVRITNTYSEVITPEIMDEILTTARDLELVVNEDDI
ncbi:hypothetical protein TNCV_4672111 [Trichonephila clavipes]|nr:hypothetical protein TNCV_4672111 [Trichonephila clavipes]